MVSLHALRVMWVATDAWGGAIRRRFPAISVVQARALAAIHEYEDALAMCVLLPRGKVRRLLKRVTSIGPRCTLLMRVSSAASRQGTEPPHTLS